MRLQVPSQPSPPASPWRIGGSRHASLDPPELIRGESAHPRRRSTSEIAKEFGDSVDFSLSPEEDELKLRYDRRHGSWEEHTWHRESDDPLHIAARARSFFAWLAAREEEEVLVSTHSAFLWHLFNHGHEGYVQNERFTEAARVTAEMTPVVEYGADVALENAMRARWENCELRSMVVVYGQQSD